MMAVMSNNDDDANATAPSMAGACHQGHHDDPLTTAFLSASQFSVLGTPYQVENEGVFVDISIPLRSLPPLTPYIVNKQGTIEHGILKTSQFLSDWSQFSEVARTSSERVFGSMGAAIGLHHGLFEGVSSATEAVSSGEVAVTRVDATNALMTWRDSEDDDAPPRGAIVDFYSVETSDGGALTLRLRWQPNPTMVAEGVGCHTYQHMDDPHYHHLLASSDLKLVVDQSDLPRAGVYSTGLTMFTKTYATIEKPSPQAQPDTLAPPTAVSGPKSAPPPKSIPPVSPGPKPSPAPPSSAPASSFVSFIFTIAISAIVCVFVVV